MTKLLTLTLVIVSIVNILPALGMFFIGAQERSYRMKVASHDLAILLRPRALLFGFIGGFEIVAAFVPAYQLPAMVMAGASLAGFVLLAYLAGDFNGAIQKVIYVDYVGLVVLGVASGVKLLD